MSQTQRLLKFLYLTDCYFFFSHHEYLLLGGVKGRVLDYMLLSSTAISCYISKENLHQLLSPSQIEVSWIILQCLLLLFVRALTKLNVVLNIKRQPCKTDEQHVICSEESHGEKAHCKQPNDCAWNYVGKTHKQPLLYKCL